MGDSYKDKSILLNIHQQQLKYIDNNNDKTNELVNILGGIDNILKLILSSNDIELHNDQLHQIHDLIKDKQQPLDPLWSSLTTTVRSMGASISSQHTIEQDKVTIYLTL